ncbi:endonuclease III, partial [Candidatus Woesearchaeota archaeon CG10_big_fil_rev_8_21_14_0_10_32_9]
LEQIAKSLPLDIKKIIHSINYNNTKAEHLVQAAQLLVKNHNGKVPSKIEELLLIPGVGRKTANLILGEIYGKDAICVDTHVHRISNVFGFVKTLTPEETEKELMKIAPKKYWTKINRIFVLWGKEVPGYDKSKFLEKIK